MAKLSLLPGFRFHPTDVELVMYYLKRKVLGKKPNFEAIAEVNIYKFSPWDLPDKSYLKTKDLEWFFFCPRERKYASGVRIKRATENGFWKTTGKDRPVKYKDKTVGMVKTLVFHTAHSSQGERTNWVIHEYRIVDDQLTAEVQDSYVLCKAFKKSGLGPKNGAQYGAPFDEAEWEDRSCLQDAKNHNMASSLKYAFDTSQSPEMESSVINALVDLETTSRLPQIKEAPSTASGPSPDVGLMNEPEDEIVHLLNSFADEPTLLFNESRNREGDMIDNGKATTSLNYYDENGMLDGVGGLDLWAAPNGCTEFGWDLQEPGSHPLMDTTMLTQDELLYYIELDDFR